MDNEKNNFGIYHLLPKNLDELMADLTIFGTQVNQRPDKPLFYSEKLLTQNQYDDYKNAIDKIYAIFKEWETISQNPKPRRPKIQTKPSTCDIHSRDADRTLQGQSRLKI